MLIIDRFEGGMAVVEYEDGTFNLPRDLLPKGAREGEVIRVSITVDKDDKEATAQRREKLEG